MSSYFSLPSFAKAKKNQEQLEKTNPQKPVLDDDDEKFFDQQIESGEAVKKTQDAAPTKIAEGGEEKELSKDETEKAGTTADQAVLPERQPETEANKEGAQPDDSAAEDPPEQAPEDTAGVEDPPEQAPEDATKDETPPALPKRPKKSKAMELPSQEEAEAATRGFNASGPPNAAATATGEGTEKRTWTSYLPTMGTGNKSSTSEQQKAPEGKANDEKPGDQASEGQSRTWAEYASSTYSALPSVPSIPAIPKPWTSKDKDSKVEPVLKDDGTIDETATKEKQEREMSVLLDNLNMSSINNRVFAFSGETQKIYERFAQVLKDTLNGAPTAYEDMDKLMKDAGPTLEKQFQSMPPFVQTLVKSLPAKLGTTLGPELLAAASTKPDDDLKTKMTSASKQSSSGGEASSSTSAGKEGAQQQKKKRKIPGLKGLISEQGAVASILRSVVNFLKFRFPFLASTTNVVMSLAVFILMFVFWYSHKRGKEVRLAQEAATGDGGDGANDDVEGEDGDMEVEVTDEEEEDEELGEKGASGGDDGADAGEENVPQGADSAAAEKASAKETDGAEEGKQDTAHAIGAAPPESVAKQEENEEAAKEKEKA
ncbi:hypothetical protein LTR62_004020 [Meristemomyces frigidus]|uniref:Uncharacterized protein n=1 Tax=Meristemomyces frigidus TaxID=1508187 RepID=A0AAN7TJA0_9PEZI|nr:hypothetical protein LTR62_004020 [Meristemomyces frigidus]